jgi:hypothetical protein
MYTKVQRRELDQMSVAVVVVVEGDEAERVRAVREGMEENGFTMMAEKREARQGAGRATHGRDGESEQIEQIKQKRRENAGRSPAPPNDFES